MWLRDIHAWLREIVDELSIDIDKTKIISRASTRQRQNIFIEDKCIEYI